MTTTISTLGESAAIKRYFILDRSGSMESMIDDTIGGFNAFVSSQKQLGGTMSLYLFDNEFDTIYEDLPISDVQLLTKATFIPRGGTALLDAIGKVIKNINNIAANTIYIDIFQEAAHIQIIIMTDGFENSSKIYTSQHIKDLIQIHSQKGWDFMYLGANQDSILEASKLGINPHQTLDFNSNNLGDIMETVSITMKQRSKGTPTTLRQCSAMREFNK